MERNRRENCPAVIGWETICIELWLAERPVGNALLTTQIMTSLPYWECCCTFMSLGQGTQWAVSMYGISRELQLPTSSFAAYQACHPPPHMLISQSEDRESFELFSILGVPNNFWHLALVVQFSSKITIVFYDESRICTHFYILLSISN